MIIYLYIYSGQVVSWCTVGRTLADSGGSASDPVTGRSQERSAPSENKRTAVESAEETAQDALTQRNRTNNYETDS